MYDIAEKTASATRWSSLTEIAIRFVLPIVNVVLARLLTPEAFGVVATITMIVSFAEIFTDAGFQKYLIQHDFCDEEELNQNTNVAFWTNLIVSLFLWGLIVVFSEQLADLVGNHGLGIVVSVSAASLPLLAFSSIQMARFKRNFDFKSLFFVRLGSMFIPIVVTIPIAYVYHSYWALIIGTLAGNLFNAVVLTWKSSWKPRIYYSWRQFKEMFSYSWWILLESVSTWLNSYMDTFIVSLFLTTYYVGLYKTSMVTVNQITSIIVSATSMPLFVALSRLKNNKPELCATYNNYMSAIAMFVLPLSAGMWFFRDFITSVLLGDQWGEAADFIGLWGLLSSISLLLGTYANGLYNAVGKTYLSFVVALINLVFMLLLLPITAPMGFESLYVSRSLLRLAFVAVQIAMMILVFRYPIVKLIRQFVPAAVCTLIMSLVAILIQPLSLSAFWQLMSVAVCVLVYFIVANVFFRKELVLSFETIGIGKTLVKKLLRRNERS